MDVCAEMLWMCVLYVSFGSNVNRSKHFTNTNRHIDRNKLQATTSNYNNTYHNTSPYKREINIS